MTSNFVILPGLPAEGPLPNQYSATGAGTHREGLVVRFSPVAAPAWVGNFQRGEGNCNLVLRHADGAGFIVIASGQAYVVDPENRELIDLFVVESHFWVDVPENNTLVITDGRWFEAYNPSGRLWRSRVVSRDAMRNLRIVGSTILGETYTEDTSWRNFCVDLSTGTAAETDEDNP